MVFVGKCDTLLKNKAAKEANEMLRAMFQGNAKELFEYTQLSWRVIKKVFIFNKHKKPETLFIPEFKSYQIEQITFHSRVMIDVFVSFAGLGKYRIRMVAEKKPYITHPEARFRYNPNNLRLIES